MEKELIVVLKRIAVSLEKLTERFEDVSSAGYDDIRGCVRTKQC